MNTGDDGRGGYETDGDRAGPTRPLRVLVVEHHVDTLREIEQLLRRFGHEPVLAPTITLAAAITARCDRTPPARSNDSGRTIDLVLVDVSLPDCDGVELVQKLKSRLGCPVWAVSRYGAAAADVTRCRPAGLDGHLIKPITADLLRSTLNTIAG